MCASKAQAFGSTVFENAAPSLIDSGVFGNNNLNITRFIGYVS